MAGPLDGIRILDLSAVISGPFGTMILADQGADVIKVETPGVGDFTRHAGNKQNGMSASFLNNNRNKRSVAIDLKSADGVAALKQIAATCHAVVQNFRPGVVERLGVGYEDLKAVRDDIVYVSISGFGERGPWADKPVYDPIVQALSGLASVQGGSDKQRPRLIRTIVPDKLTAVTASQAITAALLAQARTGTGQHVRLSMLDSVLAFLWSSDMGAQTYVGKEVTQQRAASFIDLIYETKDGHMSVAVMTNAQWQAFCKVMDHPEWIEDERFATTELRDLNIDARLELIQSVLIDRTTDDLLATLDAAGVPCAPVLHRKDVIEHPQVLAADVLREHDHPVAGLLRQTRTAARFSGTEPEYRHGAPELGAHTDEVLAEVGLSADEIARLRASKAVA
ncbi:CaiB/BaiF CoA transferase family protein [Minwuia sp.]|uniref:CaiB/BaiF CoA transferase family protein n=1 Tax=Minwuia sp. TaxID=2493630 RepID=UPI003A8D4A31